MPRLPSLCAAALVAALAVPAAAGAAYAPTFAVKLDPATPNSATALTTTLSQASGETSTKRVKLALPSRFGPAFGAQLSPCSEEQKAARACPEASRMGSARAQTLFGPFTGTVNYGPVGPGGIRIFVFLSNGVAPLDQTLEGIIGVTPTGFTTTFDGLPDVPTTTFELALDGPPRSLVKTARDCGEYIFKAELTSQKGEQVNVDAPVTVGPCADPPPRIGAVKAKGRTISFSLSEPAKVSVEVKRGRKVVFSKSLDAPAGKRTVRMARRLGRGRYRINVRAVDAAGGRSLRSGVLTVRARRR